MTDSRARQLYDDADVIETVHVIYPENCHVPIDIVLGWAHDALVNAAMDDHVKACGPLQDGPEGDAIWEAIAKAHPRPTDIIEAMSVLSDVGSHTFARMRVGVIVNRLQDLPALKALGRKCFPKKQHKTRGAAEAQMRSIVNRELAKDTETIHVYECPFCGEWHVGHGRS